MVIGGDNLPSPVEIGLTHLPNIGGASAGGPLQWPPWHPGSGITERFVYLLCCSIIFNIVFEDSVT